MQSVSYFIAMLLGPTLRYCIALRLPMKSSTGPFQNVCLFRITIIISYDKLQFVCILAFAAFISYVSNGFLLLCYSNLICQRFN